MGPTMRQKTPTRTPLTGLSVTLLCLVALAASPGCRRDTPPPQSAQGATPDAATSPSAPTSSAAPADSGPEEQVWVIRSTGLQCRPTTPRPLEDVAAELRDQGIEVHAMEMTARAVCEACGCANAEHYRLQIDASSLAQVEAAGWRQE